MRRVLILLITVSLLSVQTNVMFAQTDPDTTDPDATDPDATDPDATDPDATDPDATDPDATDPDATDPDPSGQAAMQVPTTSDGSSSSSGAGIIVLGAVAVATVLVIKNKKSKLEKTFVYDPVTNTSLTSLSTSNSEKLKWTMDTGSLSQANNQPLNLNQQVMNWRVTHSWAGDWKTKTNFGFSHNVNASGAVSNQQWLSTAINKSSLFTSSDNLSLSVGERFDRSGVREVDGYFLSTSHDVKSSANLFDLRKNLVEDSRYINLSYIQQLSQQSAINLQWQYNPQKTGENSGDSYVTAGWQYRF